MLEAATPIDNIVVVKVGTSSMLCHEDGREVLDHTAFERIGQQVLDLRANGSHTALVSSGAVTAGMEATATLIRPPADTAMPEVQRLASIGWRYVLNAWHDATPGVENGGILITRRELSLDTPEHDEALRTTHALLSHGDLPVLNENDPITHGELAHDSFGQNDELSAIYVEQIIRSTLFGNHVRLVLMTDVDGFYEDPNDPSTLVREITDISKYEHLAGDTNGNHGKGGMATKVTAAKIALSAGAEVWIVNGRAENAIQKAFDGTIGTHITG